MYGPYQPADHAYAALIPGLLDAALDKRPLKIHGDGTQSHDFTHVDTVCATLWSVVQRKPTLPDPANLAFGTRTTLLELVELIESQLGMNLERKHGGEPVGDVKASQSD